MIFIHSFSVFVVTLPSISHFCTFFHLPLPSTPVLKSLSVYFLLFWCWYFLTYLTSLLLLFCPALSILLLLLFLFLEKLCSLFLSAFSGTFNCCTLFFGSYLLPLGLFSAFSWLNCRTLRLSSFFNPSIFNFSRCKTHLDVFTESNILPPPQVSQSTRTTSSCLPGSDSTSCSRSPSASCSCHGMLK